MNDGGTAFPDGTYRKVYSELDMTPMEWGNKGMSLRQWYAGMALQGAMAIVMKHELIARGDAAEEVAAVCREIADAMIKELAE